MSSWNRARVTIRFVSIWWTRYGEFVRYRPSFSGVTIFLWVAPMLLLAAGVAIAVMTLLGRKQETDTTEALSEEEQLKLKAILDKAESNQ